MRTAETLHLKIDGCYCDQDWPMGDGHTPYCRSRSRAEVKRVCSCGRAMDNIFVGDWVVMVERGCESCRTGGSA